MLAIGSQPALIKYTQLVRMSEEKSKQRAKFSAELLVTRVELSYASGRIDKYEDQAARDIAFKDASRPNPVSALQIVQLNLQHRGVSILELGGDRALAQAAHFGRATVKSSVKWKPLDAHDFHPSTHEQVLVCADIGYQIEIRRVSDG